MMTKTIKWLAALALAGLLTGCATSRPPQRIQEAVGTLNAYMPEYVAEANAALAASGHPDAERLTGVGVRLQAGMAALDRWANREPASKEAGER